MILKTLKREDGMIPPLLLVAVIGIIGFLLIVSVVSFKKEDFSTLYPKPPSHAAGGTVDLSLTPTPISIAQGGTFNLAVNMDAKTNQVSAAQVQVNYDPTVLEAQSISAGTFLSVVLLPGAINNGAATITVGAPPGAPVSGAGTIANLSFKALKATATSVSFDVTNTQVAAIGLTGNQVGNLNPASVTVTSSATATPLPTATPTPIPTPTPNTTSYTLEGEVMSLIANSGAIQVFSDPTASGGAGLLFFSNATSNGTLTTNSNTSQVVVKAKGDQCQGAPVMAVKVDNITVLNKIKVSSTAWLDYSTARSIGPGTHTISVTFNNDYTKTKGGACDRNLRVDKVTLL